MVSVLLQKVSNPVMAKDMFTFSDVCAWTVDVIPITISAIIIAVYLRVFFIRCRLECEESLSIAK